MSANVAPRPAAVLPQTYAGLVLAVAALLWLGLFHAEAAAALHVWSTSTAYGHCFLVLPVAAFLAWERRAAWRPAQPWPAAALAVLPLAAAWLVAALLGIMEGRQLIAVGELLVLALAVLGPRLWWAFAVPLGYLFFLVPFGGFLVGPLQDVTAGCVDVGLDLLGIPHVVSRLLIEIPEGTFRVAEACAGLRFLIAAIAFGVVYACTMYRSPGRRLAFVAASVTVPVLANGVRALGIVVLGHALGSAQAGAVDHVLYGWIFFSAVLLLLILAGLPFREDFSTRIPLAPAPPPGAPRGLWGAAASALLLAALAPAALAGLGALAAAQQAALPADAGRGILARLVTPRGCERPAPDRFVCAGVPIAVAAHIFAPRSNPATLNGARLAVAGSVPGAADAEGDLATVTTWRQGGLDWQVTDAGPGVPLVATALWAGDLWQGSGLSMRLHQARASVLGGEARPVLLSVIAGGSPVAVSQTGVLQRFLAAQTQLSGGGAA